MPVLLPAPATGFRAVGAGPLYVFAGGTPLLVGSVAGTANVGHAAATGEAQALTGNTGGAMGAATGTGTGNNLTSQTAANLGAATATGTANQLTGPIFEESWAGTNNDPWSADWTTSVSTGGTVDIQSNAGRMLCGSLGAYGDYCRAILADQGAADFDLTVDLIVGDQEEKYATLSWRTDRAWDAGNPVWPDDGYVLEIEIDDNTNGYWLLAQQDAGAPTTLTSVDPFTVTSGDTFHLNVRCVDTAVDVRIWKNAEGKPGTATYSFTDSTHNARTGHGLALNGGAGTTDTVTWDNLVITPP